MYVSFDEEKMSRKCSNLSFPEFNSKAKYRSVKFKGGMVFPNLKAFKFVVKDYLVFKGKAMKLANNDKARCRAKCKDLYPWKVLCLWAKDIKSYQIKTFNDVPTCAYLL